jgi:hypothetical protein
VFERLDQSIEGLDDLIHSFNPYLLGLGLSQEISLMSLFLGLRPLLDGIGHLLCPRCKGLRCVHKWCSALVTSQGRLPVGFEFPAFVFRVCLEARMRVQQGAIGRMHVPLKLIGKEDERSSWQELSRRPPFNRLRCHSRPLYLTCHRIDHQQHAAAALLWLIRVVPIPR